MFRNFWNTLKHYKVASVLNVFGLGVAFAAFAIIMMQVRYDFTYDRFHANADRIFRVEGKLYANQPHMPMLSRPFGRMVTEASPEVERSGVMNFGGYRETVTPEGSEEGKPVYIPMVQCTPGILQMFDFRMVAGDTTRFSEPHKILIPKSMAEKYFPGSDAVGKHFIRPNTGDETEQTEVIGVFDDFPENSFLPNDAYMLIGDWSYDNWSEWSFVHFVQLRTSDKTRAEEDIYNALNKEDISGMSLQEKGGVRLTPLVDLHFQSDISSDTTVERASEMTVWSLLAIAVMIVFIAAINYINFATAMVPVRLKGVNTRRVLGCTVGTIRGEMVGEAVGLAVAGFGFGMFIVNILATSPFTTFMTVDIMLGKNLFVVGLTALTAVVTGLVAGVYPAFYIASFQPALVLKGSFGLSPRGKKLRITLISIQYVISIALIISALSIREQNQYMKHFPLGFDRENLLTMKIGPLADRPDILRDELMKNPAVKGVEFADGNVVSFQKMGWGRYDEETGTDINFDVLPVSPGFTRLLGIEITEGRDFVPSDGETEVGVMLLNETAKKAYGLTLESHTIGHTNQPSVLVGFMKDFHFMPLQYGIKPFALYVGGPNWKALGTAYVRVDGADMGETIKYIRETLIRLDPGMDEVQIDFLDSSIGRLYEKEERLAALITTFSLLAVFISIVGVFGIVLFEIQSRRREIALRKVHGASVGEVLSLINRGFVVTVTVCFIFAAPLAWWAFQSWQSEFAYRWRMEWWVFAISFLVVLAITLVTVTLQSLRAARANPIEILQK